MFEGLKRFLDIPFVPITEDEAPAGMGCGRCGETRIDFLEFTEEDDEIIRCLTCGHVYKVGGQ
jgi:hypothetical protein